MYFREFGIPARIARCFSKEELDKKTKGYNGQKNCYTSVYVFDDLMDKSSGKTDYSSAVLNTLWFDFDDDIKVENCLKDVRKLYKKYCKGNNIEPRIFFTGGRGFQINIDFHSPLDVPNFIKKDCVRDYLLFLKTKYKLKTLDKVCIQNSTSAMRRLYNTKYMSKLTKEETGYYCVEISINEMLKLSMDKIRNLALKPRSITMPKRNKRAQRDFLDFICDKYEIKHTISNSASYLLDEIGKAVGSTRRGFTVHSGLIKAPRKCIMELIELNIDKGHSSHTENNIIATELINAGWNDVDISFVFKSIYDEPANNWGWYEDDPTIAGRRIKRFREEGLSRYSLDKLKQIGVL